MLESTLNCTRSECVLKKKSFYSRSFQIMSKMISLTRQNLRNPNSRVYKLRLKLEKYKYKEGLQFFLLTLSKKKRCSLKTFRLFQLGAKKLGSGFGDLIMVSPDNITELCKKILNDILR